MTEETGKTKAKGGGFPVSLLIIFTMIAGIAVWVISHPKKQPPPVRGTIAGTVAAIQAVPPQIGPVDPKIQRLADYAKAHGIRWRIYCTSSATEESYTGWAIQPGADFEEYTDFGGKNSWLTYEHSTQKAVATELYMLLRHKPNNLAVPRPAVRDYDPPKGAKNKTEEPQKPLKCMKEITSENVGQKCEACDTVGH